MIISVSRRTDVPAFYSEWFFNRIREGFAETKNPMNPKQVRMVSLRPEGVDCFVFWSKNPLPMMEKLDLLKGYGFYFQFTLNGYGEDIEVDVPALEKRVETMKALCDKVGKERVVWRYDPILITERYSTEFHRDMFGRLADKLEGCFNEAVISFVDRYGKNARRFDEKGIREPTYQEMRSIAESFATVGKERSFEINTCAEKAELGEYGIGHSSCIDVRRIRRIIGREVNAATDRNQREGCRCASSVDIGAYDTCLHGCVYCYANRSDKSAQGGFTKHDPASPRL